MSDFREYLNEQLKNPEFKKEWDALETEFNMIQAIIDARRNDAKNTIHPPLSPASDG